jgi:hypothetical protein
MRSAAGGWDRNGALMLTYADVCYVCARMLTYADVWRVRQERRSAGQKKGEEDAEEVMQGGRGRERRGAARLC